MSSINPLCCCEYYDIHEERNHILACCCNCHDLDESFESLITCNSISSNQSAGVLAVMLDRIRIPWKGGAMKVTPDAVLAIIIITVGMLLSSISLNWSIGVCIVTLVFVFYLYKVLPSKIPSTKFFFVWTIYSAVILFVIFEYFVVPLLEILLNENLILGVMVLGFGYCLFKTKKKSESLLKVQGTFGKTESNRNYHCTVCLMTVPQGDFHSFWFDCCIGVHNHVYYIFAQLFAIIALAYSADLTLTSVCHPFSVYTYILLPDDCSDVYQDWQLGISFVGACYSLLIFFFLVVVHVHQVILISLGVTWQEWRANNFCRRMLCCMERPYSKNIVENWLKSMRNSFAK